LSGDERVNENPNLQLMHTLWSREHNRLADEIKKSYENGGIDKNFTGEGIFQEARRLKRRLLNYILKGFLSLFIFRYLIAELQMIVYNEWLPLVLGKEVMAKYGLSVDGPSLYSKQVGYTWT